MIAQVQTFTVEGTAARAVSIEVDVRPGLPAFSIIGFADGAVRETRERVRAAILNSGYELPAQRITANISPLQTRRPGPGIDLALACALLAASGQIPRPRQATHALFAELMLDGRVRRCPNALTVAESAASEGIATLVLAPQDARAAAAVQGVTLVAVDDLRAAARALADDDAEPADANNSRGQQGRQRAAPQTGPGAHTGRAPRNDEYRVMWEIDLCATSAREAAKQALAIQRDPQSNATVFAVCRLGGGTPARIDLDAHDEDENTADQEQRVRRTRRT
jgi:predicted ATPase with chaperone activity